LSAESLVLADGVSKISKVGKNTGKQKCQLDFSGDGSDVSLIADLGFQQDIFIEKER
jgi:hypothetical protein